MMKKKAKMQFRFYEMGPNTQVLALLGEDWIRPYGQDIVDLHFHNYMELGICYDGHGECTLRDKNCPFQKGSILVIPPNYPHNNTTDKGTVAYWEWMYFDMDNVIKDMNEMSHNKLDTEKLLNMIYSGPLFYQKEEYQTLSNIIMEIREENYRKEYMYHEKVRGLLQSFTVELIRIHNVNSKMSRKNPRNIQIVPALNYVKAHYNDENIRIQDLADVCNISESHFRRIFQECMNMTPNDYVNVIRIHEACNLLLKKHATMDEIAYRVGYGNVSTFNRNFKRIIGMSPYQWKKSPENYAGQMMNFNISALKGW